MKKFSFLIAAMLGVLIILTLPAPLPASSHREAPLISADPLADNTDLYIFRAPDDPNMVVIVANYIPLELPEGGPNYATFGEGIRYEIHIKNQTSVGPLGSAKDDITYRFIFTQVNEDPTTFFNIRLGMQNLKTTYVAEKSTDGGATFYPIVSNGIVPPNNIGPRSIEGGAGLNTSYASLVQNAIATASSGEIIFCGPRDDVFFVDLGGVFDLGQTRSAFGTDPSNPNNARDAVAGFNTHSIVMKIPISNLQKDGLPVSQASSILDPNFVIGVWASASRQQIRVLSPVGAPPIHSGPWIQVSRLGMPLANEAVIPIGEKDYWNAVSPYSVDEQNFVAFYANPEIGLYMDDSKFGGAVPALAALRIQSASYPAIGVIPGYSAPGFDFRNGKDGAFAAAFIPGINFSGTAIAVPTGPAAPGMPIQTALVAPGEPRRADIFPIFYFGVPALKPYELATGKTGGPLSKGKPFIHNFLPITSDNGVLYGGDLLRLNMATPATDRSSTEFQQNARMGLIRAAVLGLTDPAYADTTLQAIAHMDGFPNGRRLEDDVTTIALQALGGLVLAAVGFPFDDAIAPDYSDLASPNLVAELTYNAGPTANDLPILASFPYLPDPHRGYDYVKQLTAAPPAGTVGISSPMGLSVPRGFILEQNYPNPFNPSTTIKYQISKADMVRLRVFDTLGREVATLVNERQPVGIHTVNWEARGLASGTYFYRLEVGNDFVTKKSVLLK
ncbi:MAG: DUF4331 family protein [Calditrichaceae bacterium]|nr:DUF4331 family protein [Calditrichia bacterium]NUQ40694.1 DUF4331 family protein [Calditrichaceae bacterium]